MIKLSIVVGVLNGFDLTRETAKMMVDNLDHPEETELIFIDNGSEPPFPLLPVWLSEHVRVVRNDQNVGNYPLFDQGLWLAQGQIIAFIHSDVFIHQKGWDTTVRAQFDASPELGLVGFIGSTEMDNWGGRGMGTVSNMQGATYYSGVLTGDPKFWTGSKAEIHGKRDTGFIIDGSVVDGCVMIFRRSVLEQLDVKENFPIHHHYDRLLSCQVLEAGYKVGIAGVAFDHISGQTANTQQTYQDVAKLWFKEHLNIDTPQEWAELRKDWVRRVDNPSRNQVPQQWDHATYLEAEFQFLSEYRDQKHMVPNVYGKSLGV